MIQVYAGLAVVTLVGGLGYSGYQYYVHTQNKIATLSENIIKVEMAKAKQDSTIKALQEDRDKFQKLNTELSAKIIEANKYKDKLIDKLRKHDLTSLSMKKPMMIEKRINNATKKLFKHFEDFSRIKPSKPNNGVQQPEGSATHKSADR
tara:strand:- start:65 stop:511 length:447 start_codon:yes stop_codon:yes gene_type:complete